ncbi:MAG: alkaline phosphatase D family protein [Planctomycetota bacterium]|nr:alkaline phosphatase D family protein [Planctomycetota bacterium]
MQTRTLAALLILLVAALLAAPLEAKPQRPRGPLVGHVGPTTAVLWFYTGYRPGVRLYYRPADAPKTAARWIPMPAAATGPQTARVTVRDLQPDTDYVYRFTFKGRTEDTWAGRFRTAPKAGAATRFRLAVTSCMKHDHDYQDAWRHLLAEKPDFQLLLGDNVYADSTTRKVLWDHHLRMRGVWQFAQVIRNVPTYAMWDDHDFAGDNRGGEVKTKARSLDVFQELWANPAAGAPGVPGAFFQLSRGDVDFFVLDGRYYRSRVEARNDSRKRMIGDAQFRWLAERMRASTARFKVIASGSTIEVEGEDTWVNYRFDLERIWKLVQTERIGGVIWLSGDLHESQIETHAKARTGFYDLTEVISSGIANSRDHEFAVLDFDTTVEDPTCHIRIIDGHGKLFQGTTLRASALQVR